MSLALTVLLGWWFGEHADRAQVEKIAYLALSQGYWQAWVMDADGEDARQITRSPGDKVRISWFPAGDELLVNTQEGRLLRVGLETDDESEIPLTVSGMLDGVLSPDGRTIAFSLSPARSRDDNEIWTVNVDGTQLRKLTNMPALQHQPRWSRNGEWIYFHSGGGGDDHDVWRISTDGLRLEQLTVNNRFHFGVDVAPDGTLAYSNDCTDDFELWLQRPNGERVQLTDSPGVDDYPSWSPDGKSLAFESAREGELQIWRLRIGEPHPIRLTRHRRGARRPAWWGPSPAASP